MNKNSIIIFIFIPLVNARSEGQTQSALNFRDLDGQVNTRYDFNVIKGSEVVYTFVLEEGNINFDTDEIRLQATVDSTHQSDHCPVLMTVNRGTHVDSFDLPHRYNETYYRTWGKTICIDNVPQEEPYKGKVEISVVTSTCYQTPIGVSLILSHIPMGLRLTLGEERAPLYVAPTTSQFFKFDFNTEGHQDVQTVLVTINALNVGGERDPCEQDSSSDCKCMTVSLQPASRCPVYDEVTNVRYVGVWQTLSTMAGITVERNEFLNDQFFVVLVTEYDDEACKNRQGYSGNTAYYAYAKAHSAGDPVHLSTLGGGRSQGQTATGMEREKELMLTVEKVLSPSEYVWPTLFPLAVYGAVILLTFIVFVMFHRANARRYSTHNKQDPIACLSFLRSEKCICDTHDELDAFKREQLQNKSLRYLWLFITVAIFYSIPVFQLIVNYLFMLYRTGEQDICYYNNLCSLPLNRVFDFNHIYSNIGYVIFGILFILFTFLRHETVKGRRGFFTFETKPVFFGLLDSIPRRVEYGTLDHYGTFYALGFALFMEGFLSASYHICPNKANFQFDTSFMYAMAALSYVKVYQFRHFFYMNELISGLMLALIVTCVVLGLFSLSLAYNIVLSVVHMVLVIFVQILLAFEGRVKDNWDKDRNTLLQEYVGVTLELLFISGRKDYLVKHHPNRSLFWWTLGWNVLLIVNSWTLVYGSNFATQVLYILLANMTIYVVYYIAMKVIHGEFEGLCSEGLLNPSLQPLIYGFLALLFGLPGVYYFMNPLTDWELPPAQSRGKNGNCALFEFYDNHDIWHLLSAPALFFSFMMFLTIDDGILGKHQASIPVF